MKSKLKNMAIAFLIMIIFNAVFSPNILWDLGFEAPHVGLLFSLGLLFGPYGALGAVFANILIDIYGGFTFIEALPSVIISFGVSYLAYKLWYSGFKTKKITRPILDNIYHLSLFLCIMIICGFIYSTVHGDLAGIFIGADIDEYYFITYFLNFINIAFVFGILSIWLSKRFDFIEIPKKSQRPANKKLYQTIFLLLIIVTIASAISLLLKLNHGMAIAEVALIGVLLFAYLTKPMEHDIEETDKNTIIEKIIRNFLILTLTVTIIGMIISVLSYFFITHVLEINVYLFMMPALIITDAILILFFVPGIIILRYIEQKVLKPVSSFSEIENFISENEKIEAEGLLKVYSEYLDEDTEIGTLARSYTRLIKHNNNYIENIREIEGEKERINAELDIATRIQAAALPTERLDNSNFIVDGYSHPAKEVGGDFYDYYMIDDDNLAIVIGDASGKGVPAALIAMNTQVVLKQVLKHDTDPSRAIYQLNNQLCENNPESMFLTLWLGIYNRTTNKLRFSNAGHNPPLIKENGKFRYMNIDSGLVLGVMEDFEYVLGDIDLTDELILYTDGITDANNEDNKMYGENRLLEFLNTLKDDEDRITSLLNDVADFTGDKKQYDDMTLLYLKIK